MSGDLPPGVTDHDIDVAAGYYDDDDGCYECGGEGWVENDCVEDTCCCADPELSHGMRRCSLCNPKGTK